MGPSRRGAAQACRVVLSTPAAPPSPVAGRLRQGYEPMSLRAFAAFETVSTTVAPPLPVVVA